MGRIKRCGPFTFKVLHGKFIPKAIKAPQNIGKTDVQTVIAHKLGKRLGQHAAALQIAKKAIKDYVVTPDIKIAVTLPSTIAFIPRRCKSEKSEEA